MSACEEAGYIFGTHENGVRGKAGTPGFWAPEMLYYEDDGKGRRYGPAADIWSFGCVVYSLLASRGPFTVLGGDTADDNAATLAKEPDLNPSIFSPLATSLLKGLFEVDPSRRLGCGLTSIAEVQAHPFFAGIDWVAMETKLVDPPFKPTHNVFTAGKTVRAMSDKDRAKLAAVSLTPADHARFKGIPFVSQKAVAAEIIQNVAITEYAAEHFCEPVPPAAAVSLSSSGAGAYLLAGAGEDSPHGAARPAHARKASCTVM